MTRLSEMFNVNHFIVSQVNPHVVPFLPKEDGPSNTSEHLSVYVPNWVNTMTHLAKDEVLHRMTVLSELGVFPTSMTKFASIMNQKYSGDINIYPELISSNIPRILENPTTEFMLEACLSGERATWPRLSRIRNACAIELALDRAIQQMRARVTFSSGRHDLRIYDSMDSSAGRGRIRNRRRASHGFELMRRCSRGSSQSRPPQELRKARSTLSLEEPFYTLSKEPISAATRPRAHQRRSSISFGGRIFKVGSGSEDEDGSDLAYSKRPRHTQHRASWDASSYDREFGIGQCSPAQTRRSSFSSGKSHRPTSDRRCSPKQVQAPSARDISMALSPSSRHMLSMTPKAQPSS